MIRGGSILMAAGVSLGAIALVFDDMLSTMMLRETMSGRWMISEVSMIFSGTTLFLCGVILSSVGVLRRRHMVLGCSGQAHVASYDGKHSLSGRADPYPSSGNGDALYYFAGALVIFTVIALAFGVYFDG